MLVTKKPTQTYEAYQFTGVADECGVCRIKELGIFLKENKKTSLSFKNFDAYTYEDGVYFRLVMLSDWFVKGEEGNIEVYMDKDFKRIFQEVKE